jgi:hypothetical protein
MSPSILLIRGVAAVAVLGEAAEPFLVDRVGAAGAADARLIATDVVPEPGTFVINIADAMQVWTNDRWVSTLHRVVNPPRELADTSRRHSMPFFHQPNYDAIIDTLPSCYGPDRPRRYQPVTFGEHWMSKWMATKAA